MDAVSGNAIAIAAVVFQFVVSAISEWWPGGRLKKGISTILMLGIAALAIAGVLHSDRSAATADSKLDEIRAKQGDPRAVETLIRHQRELVHTITGKSADEFVDVLTRELPAKVQSRAEIDRAGSSLAAPFLIRWQSIHELIVQHFSERAMRLKDRGLISDSRVNGEPGLLVQNQPVTGDWVRRAQLAPGAALVLYLWPARFDSGVYVSGPELSLNYELSNHNEVLMRYRLEQDVTRVASGESLSHHGFESYSSTAATPVEDSVLLEKIAESVNRSIEYAITETQYLNKSTQPK